MYINIFINIQYIKHLSDRNLLVSSVSIRRMSLTNTPQFWYNCGCYLCTLASDLCPCHVASILV